MQQSKSMQKETLYWLSLAVVFTAIWSYLAAPEAKLQLTVGALFLSSLIAGLLYRVFKLPARRWSALQTHLQTEESLDVQRNFLSLLSHNLNTPIAKLLGILQILVATHKDQIQLFMPLQRCLGRTLRIQTYSKSTLQTSSLLNHDEKGIQAVPLKTIFEAVAEALHKLESFIEVKFEYQQGQDISDFQHLPVLFEQRQVSQLAAGIAYIVQRKHPQPIWLLTFDFHLSFADLPSNQNRLSITFSARETLKPENISWFEPSATEKDFLTELNQEHLREILRLYQGSIKITDEGTLLVSLNSLAS